jgi:hypothetical protein
MRDTSDAADRRYHELLREKAPHERLAQAMALSNAVRQMAMAGLRARHPAATEDELRVRYVVRVYGRAAAERLFGSVPEDAV